MNYVPLDGRSNGPDLIFFTCTAVLYRNMVPRTTVLYRSTLIPMILKKIRR